MKTEKESQSTENWRGSEPLIPESSIVQTVETELVVVGGGLAGVAAIRQAASMGTKVVLFEKCKSPQARSGDFAILDSEIADLWGRRGIDKNAVVADLMRDMGYRADQRILKAWAKEAGEAFDWYIRACPELLVLKNSREPVPKGTKCWIQPRRYPEPESFEHEKEPFKCYQTTVWVRPTHIPVFKANYALAEQTGNLTSFFSAPARKLLRDENGRVNGVLAEHPEGGYIRALASKGVILATGDYSSDDAMLGHYCPGALCLPRMWTSYDRNKQPSNTGDGHRMAMWAGAHMQDSPHAPMAHHMGGALGASGFLLLNLEGERFVNEDCPGQQINNQIVLQPGKTAWQIADGNWRDQVPFVTPNHGSVCYVMEDSELESGKVYPHLGTIDNITTPRTLEKAIESGEMLRADTIEELIEKMGLPAETAKSEIERYNRCCREKYDSDFGKQSKRLFPVEKPPFYATRFTPAIMIICMGGLDSDQYCRTYDDQGRIIPGLYVTGNVQGNRFSGEYPLTVPGISHSMALTLGRIAGRSAAEGR